MKNPRLETIAKRYKAAIASRYRAIKPSDINLIPHGPCFVSPKIDGELWLAELNGNQVHMFAKGGRHLDSGPINEALVTLSASVNDSIVIAGELHSQGSPGHRPRVGDVASALAENKQSELVLTLFDVVQHKGEQPPINYHERLQLLESLVPKPLKYLRVAETEELNEPSHLTPHIKRWLENGESEGLVVRSSVGEIYKIKPSISIDALVVGYTTRSGTEEQVRSLLLGLQRSDGTTQLLGACGNFPSEELRRELIGILKPLECASSFRHSSSDGNLYQFVEPEIVLEVSCTDLQDEDSDGDPIKRWVLKHSPKGWLPVVDLPSASMIHPVIIRRRTDKTNDSVDVRVTQLNEHISVVNIDAKAVARQLPKSQLLRRQVWSKTSKSGLAVRKLLVWSSGKQDIWPGWPAWLVHFTDYSPDRKTPLDRTIRTAQSEVEALAIADAMVSENIKKGWEEARPLPEAEPPPPKEPSAAASKSNTKPKKSRKPSNKKPKQDQ